MNVKEDRDGNGRDINSSNASQVMFWCSFKVRNVDELAQAGQKPRLVLRIAQLRAQVSRNSRWSRGVAFLAVGGIFAAVPGTLRKVNGYVSCPGLSIVNLLLLRLFSVKLGFNLGYSVGSCRLGQRRLSNRLLSLDSTSRLERHGDVMIAKWWGSNWIGEFGSADRCSPRGLKVWICKRGLGSLLCSVSRRQCGNWPG